VTVRLGFLGVGWIGQNRMEAMLATGKASAVGICDSSSDAATQAHLLAPDAILVSSLDDMLALEPDGIVIATPSAQHAQQSIESLKRGAAVFCQKPLARNTLEVEAVLDAARKADRLLGVDLSYRHTAAMQAIRGLVSSGALGKPFAADFMFHNAYGPGSAWFYDPELSGGGCLIDVGVHLVDLALWLFDFAEVVEARGRLLKDGRPAQPDECEDFATGELELSNGVTARIACSWNLSAGQDADIRATVYGTEGGAEMRNENGSFFDFSADLFEGRQRRQLASPPDDWGGRAAADWVDKLASGAKFDQSTTGLLETARALDALYGRAPEETSR
jgi:predicted dehydrogenase